MVQIRLSEETLNRISSFYMTNLTFTVGDKKRVVDETSWETKIRTVLDALEGLARITAEARLKPCSK